MLSLTRRKFLLASGATAATSLMTIQAQANYFTDVGTVSSESLPNLAVAPKAPPAKSVTISAKVVPNSKRAKFRWEFAQDEFFESIVQSDTAIYLTNEAFNVNITLHQVPSGSTLYYRFIYDGCEVYVNGELTGEEVNYEVFPTTAVTTSLVNLRSKTNSAINKTA